jgi:hypothetical protein
MESLYNLADEVVAHRAAKGASKILPAACDILRSLSQFLAYRFPSAQIAR